MKALAPCVLLAACGTALAASSGALVQAIHDETTAGRRLVKAALPPYPAEEMGRWTESCVAVYFTVRPDGKTDQFVVLESSRPSADSVAERKGPGRSSVKTGPSGEARKFDEMTEDEKKQDARFMWRFVQPSLKAVVQWEYAPAGKASDEIAVFRFERSEMGGHVMKIDARRLDLGTKPPQACTSLDIAKVRTDVAKARGSR